MADSIPNIAQKVETREDEEQGKKFHETVELLLAAGYFRARIKGLSPFDKVVGGMTWCITTCDFDVDVDLLFQENSTIGQKISLTEKIVAVLPRMKCPHRIEPHQIQGLDFIHIFPVIQWLVKRAIETREELGDKIRQYSITQFFKSHSMPQDVEAKEKEFLSLETVKVFKESYKPKRVFKKPTKFMQADEETQVQSTLLEYGQRYGFNNKALKEETEAKQKAIAAGLVKLQDSNSAETAEEEEKKLKSLMEGMSEADIQQMISSQAVGSIVGMKSDEISKIANEYLERQAALEQETNDLKAGKVSGLQTHNRYVAALEKSILAEKEKVQKASEEQVEVEKQVEESRQKYNKNVEYKEKLRIETKKLNDMETEQTKNIMSKLQALVALNESLKKQEQEFKAHCKVELKEIEEKMAALQSVVSEGNNAEAERLKVINDQFENDTEKMRKIRLLQAKRNREIASLQWKIDDVPTRAELKQYQCRFIELYNQVASTHKETKQFYTLYNTLDDTKLYLEKEVGYLNSIHDGFEQASQSSETSKEEFLRQLEKIIQGVKTTEEKLQKKLTQEKDKRYNCNETHMELVDKQRAYFKTVREFQEECKKAEILLSKMKATGIAE